MFKIFTKYTLLYYLTHQIILKNSMCRRFHRLKIDQLYKGCILLGHTTQPLETSGISALRPQWRVELTWFQVCDISWYALIHVLFSRTSTTAAPAALPILMAARSSTNVWTWDNQPDTQWLGVTKSYPNQDTSCPSSEPPNPQESTKSRESGETGTTKE